MESIYVFLIRNDIWIYILAALGTFWYVSELVRARRLLRRAMFGLEREKGQRMQRSAVAVIVVLATVVSLVAYVNKEIAPTLPPSLLLPPTPTPNVFATPFSAPAESTLAATATVGLAPTVTLQPTLTPAESTAESTSESVESQGTSVSTATPTHVVGDCRPEAIITSPPSGVTVPGPVTFFGTASGPGFSQYYLELMGPETDGLWRRLGDVSLAPVIDAILASADLSDWEAGSYLVRLNVETDDEVNQCIVEIEVQQ